MDIAYQDVAMKVLKYAASIPSNEAIVPRTNKDSLNGFSYPALAEALGDSGYLDSMILKKLEDAGYLIGEFFERVLLCPHCMAYNICFRDICPECSSANLERVQMIHHFRCAYVGPEKEFIKDGRLSCPKCNTNLLHVGKDYERPSEVFKCLDCDWSGSETSTGGHCVFCDKKVEPEQCVVYDIKIYRIGPDGSRTVRMGRFLSDEVKESSHLDTQTQGNNQSEEFSKLQPLLKLTNELGRLSESFGVSLSVICMIPDVLKQTKSSVNEDLAEDFCLAVMEKVKDLLRPTDYLTLAGGDNLLAVLPQTEKSQALELADSLNNEISALTFSGHIAHSSLSCGVIEWQRGRNSKWLYAEAYRQAVENCEKKMTIN
jgi:GGDEF domain-containing protein